MTTVKWKFHERWRLRRKSHKFNPGSSFWSRPRLKPVHHSRAKVRLYHAQARSVSPDEDGDQWGWGFQMLPMCFFPNARIQWTICHVLHQKFLFSTPNPSWACYFQFFDTLQLWFKSIPKINDLLNFLNVGCQYGKKSDRKQGESTTFFISTQTCRDRELNTQCDCYCHRNGNDIAGLIYFHSCRNQEFLPSSFRAISKSFWVENKSEKFQLAATKQQFS